jgi:hypothetical protein
MYGLKMPAKYWDLVSMYSGPLGPLKGWGTLANYLLANCDQFTACNCETILILNVSFKHENCSHASVEGAPKVLGHASIS